MIFRRQSRCNACCNCEAAFTPKKYISSSKSKSLQGLFISNEPSPPSLPSTIYSLHQNHITNKKHTTQAKCHRPKGSLVRAFWPSLSCMAYARRMDTRWPTMVLSHRPDLTHSASPLRTYTTILQTRLLLPRSLTESTQTSQLQRQLFMMSHPSSLPRPPRRSIQISQLQEQPFTMSRPSSQSRPPRELTQTSQPQRQLFIISRPSSLPQPPTESTGTRQLQGQQSLACSPFGHLQPYLQAV